MLYQIAAYGVSALDKAKLIIRFVFPPARFLQVPKKISLFGNLHHMDFQILTKFFHYCINEAF